MREAGHHAGATGRDAESGLIWSLHVWPLGESLGASDGLMTAISVYLSLSLSLNISTLVTNVECQQSCIDWGLSRCNPERRMTQPIYAKTTYTKLFQKILDSTVWGENDRTRIVWITMLAMADSEGCVIASLPGLARRAVVPLDDAALAVQKFLAPDPHSTTPDHEGRRIEAIDGGWRLLNHAKYKAMMTLEHRREYNRLKQQEYRQRGRGLDKEKTLRQRIKEKAKIEDAVDRL